MTAAHRLLLALLRRDATRDSLRFADAAAFERLLEITPRDLHPWLAWRIPQLVEPRVLPSGVAESLALASRGAVLRHLQRHAVLRRLSQALDAAGVPFVVLKGAALAHLAYPSPALRSMGDIDLWTLPEHLDAASAAVLGAGMRYPERLQSRMSAADRLEERSTRVFESDAGEVVLELHGVVQSMTAAAPGWSGDAWSRAVERDLGGVRARVPHPEDMLTHLAMHCSAHHRFEMGLRPLLDIALWLEATAGACDPAALGDQWRRYGCATWNQLTLALVRDLLGADPLPALSDVSAMPHGAELSELARAQVMDAVLTMPPTLARLAATPTGAGRARWMLHRLTAWYWQGPPGSRRTPLVATRDAFSRMASDLRTKLPAYLRGLRDGSLRGSELRRRQELAIGRRRLGELVAEATGGTGELR
jgi:hypothetical protein